MTHNLIPATSIRIGSVVIHQDDQGRYSLNDLHKAAGGHKRHRPNYWLKNEQTQSLIAEIEKAGIPAIFAKQGFGTYVCKELVYSYATWISAAFHLRVIRTYDAVMMQRQADTERLAAVIAPELLRADPRRRQLVRYRRLGLTLPEIQRLTGRGKDSLNREYRLLEACGLVAVDPRRAARRAVALANLARIGRAA